MTLVPPSFYTQKVTTNRLWRFLKDHISVGSGPGNGFLLFWKNLEEIDMKDRQDRQTSEDIVDRVLYTVYCVFKFLEWRNIKFKVFKDRQVGEEN